MITDKMCRTQPDVPPCYVWYVPKNLWSNGAELFNSSVQLVIVAVGVFNHIYRDNAPERVVWCGKIRTTQLSA
jgi:hypothetical protein